MNELKMKRVYESAEPTDGTRILVDRLWPRGISKERAALTRWEKEITPSPDLRKWFGHEPERFATSLRSSTGKNWMRILREKGFFPRYGIS